MICRSCKSEKMPGDFYAGVKSRCKECHKAAMKIRRLTDPKVQEYERQRSKTPERQKHIAKTSKKWREKHPDAYRAHTALNNALRDGRIQKQPCAICGTSNRVHAHHSDYARPLDVKWLCAKCHHRIHAVFPELHGHGATA